MRLPPGTTHRPEGIEAGAQRQVRELIAHCTVVATLAVRMQTQHRPGRKWSDS